MTAYRPMRVRVALRLATLEDLRAHVAGCVPCATASTQIQELRFESEQRGPEPSTLDLLQASVIATAMCAEGRRLKTIAREAYRDAPPMEDR